jgi:hypothetical protein
MNVVTLDSERGNVTPKVVIAISSNTCRASGMDSPTNGSVSYGFLIGPITRYNHEDTEQGGMISKYARTDLVGLLGKLVSVIELGLFNCNRLGLGKLPCPLTYIKRGRQHPLYINSIIQSNKRYHTDWT